MTLDWRKDHEGFPFIQKDPNAVLDYRMDWAGWLEGDIIANAEWFPEPPGLIQESKQVTDSDATVWLSGGEIGVTYDLTCRITTASGRVEDRRIRIKVVQR